MGGSDQLRRSGYPTRNGAVRPYSTIDSWSSRGNLKIGLSSGETVPVEAKKGNEQRHIVTATAAHSGFPATTAILNIVQDSRSGDDCVVELRGCNVSE